LEDLDFAADCLDVFVAGAFFDFEMRVFLAGVFFAVEEVVFRAAWKEGNSGNAGRIKASNRGSSRTILTPASLTKGKDVKNPAA
jgi:hypothetical protein